MHKLDEIKDFEIQCMEKQLELVNEWKLLGVTIDQHLDWKSYINKLPKNATQCYRCSISFKDTLFFTCGNK